MTSHTVGTAFLKPLRANSDNPIVLEANETMIGRDPSCQIVLADEGGVSRRHAVIYHRGQQFLIVDLNSSNGTFVNNQRLQSEQILNTGDRIQLGGQGPQFAFINPAVDNALPATQAYTPNNNLAPTMIRTPAVAQPPAIAQPHPQPAYPSEPSSSNSPKWGWMIGGVCIVGVALLVLSGISARLRSIGSSPSTQQPITASPSQPSTTSPQAPTQPSQAPTTSQPSPSQPNQPTFANGVENAFVCESTTSQPCTADANRITRDSSLAYTVFYSRPLDAPVQFRSSIRYTPPNGQQRQFDLGSDSFQRAARSFTVPLGKPNGGWRPGTYDFTVEAQSAGRRIVQTASIVIQ